MIHLVAQEACKALLGPQVVDHMAAQLTTAGSDRPARIVIGLLETGRAAASGATRRAVATLASRPGSPPVILLPYVSRLGMRINARGIALRLRRGVGPLPVVFHCRNEAAVEWAVALRRHFARAAIVADIRGPWPEDLVFARGFSAPHEADQATQRDYQGAMRALHAALAEVDEVCSVSAGMLDWIENLGVPRRMLHYVPCSVSRITFDPVARATIRESLGLEERLVFAALVGDTTRYQHLDDAIAPFLGVLRQRGARPHLLCIASAPETARALLARAGVPAEDMTVLGLPQSSVGAYLSAADAGFLLKAPSRLNHVVQPVKLGEFLSAGVPVIVSRGIGRVDAMIGEAGAGVVVDLFGGEAEIGAAASAVLEALRTRGTAMRAAALELCERALLWSEHVPTVRTAYRRALDNQRPRTRMLR